MADDHIEFDWDLGNIEHIRQLRTIPAWGVIVGRSLYEGTVDLAEAIRVASAP